MVFWSKPPVAYSKLQAYTGKGWKNVYMTDTLADNLNVTNATHNLAVLYGFNGVSWDKIRTHYLFIENFTEAKVGVNYDTVSGTKFHTIHITADNTGFSISLEGSIDGTNWFSLYDIESENATDTEYVVFINYKLTRYLRFNCKDMGSATSIIARYFGNR